MVDRKDSLFTRFKRNEEEHRNQNGLHGISSEELEEFREAFRLFDKVGI
jgi:hypothetical protein